MKIFLTGVNSVNIYKVNLYIWDIGYIFKVSENIYKVTENILIKLWKYCLELASGYENIYEAVKIFRLA